MSKEEARSLGLPVLNPMTDALEREYEKYVTESPEERAAREWSAERVGVPLWVQERSEMYANEAKKRMALLEKGSPDWGKLAGGSPVTAAFMLEEGVMASAYDDTEELARIEEASSRAGSLSAMPLSDSRGKGRRQRQLQRMRGEGAASTPQRPAAPIGDVETVEREKNVLSFLSSAREWLLDPRSGEKNMERLRERLGMEGMSQEEQRLAIDERILGPIVSNYRALDGFLSKHFFDFSLGKGFGSGYEMSSLGDDAVNLFLSESAANKGGEAKWVDKEKRLLGLDRNSPDGFFSGMLYETGKVFGQQAHGRNTILTFAATGGALGGYSGLVAAGTGALLAPAALPAIGVGVLSGWLIGATAAHYWKLRFMHCRRMRTWKI